MEYENSTALRGEDVRPSPVTNVFVRRFGWTFLVILVAASIEAIAYVSLHYVMPKGKAAYLTYLPPAYPSEAEYANYLATRDPTLGWPQRGAENRLDSAGSRYVPSYPTPGGECVSLYGDSYVYGSDVSDVDAWGNVLAELLGCRVSNFGVPAFGTDQALMRFSKTLEDKAPVSVLGVFPDDFKRNVNQYRYFIDGQATNRFVFKPRFVLSATGKLELVPLPHITRSEFADFIAHPNQFLQHEFFLPGSLHGSVPLEFPFSVAIWRLLRRPEVASWLRGHPDWYDFVQRGHPSAALETTVATAKRFIDLCTERSKQCLVVLFPSRNAYEYFVREDASPLQVFLAELDKQGVAYLDLAPTFADALGKRSLCEVLANPTRCSGHYGPEGNVLVARALHAVVQEKLASQSTVANDRVQTLMERQLTTQ